MNREEYKKASVEELLERAREDDRGAFEELFRRYGRRLTRWASRSIAGTSLGTIRPSDVVQDATSRALEKFSTFDGKTEGDWSKWLEKICKNAFLRLIRSAHTQKRDIDKTLPGDSDEASEVLDREESPSQTASHQELQHQLLAHLYALGDQGKAFWYYKLMDLPVAEVASIMNRTEPAIRGLSARGNKALKNRMFNNVTAHLEDGDVDSAPLNEAEAAFVSYLCRRDAEERVDVDAFVAEHPACADELRSMIEWLAHIQDVYSAPPESR